MTLSTIRHLLILLLLFPFIAAGQNSRFKFSSSSLSVTVETGKMVSFPTLKLLNENGSPAVATSIEYKFTPASVVASIPGFPSNMLQTTGPDGGLPGFKTTMAPGSFVLTLTVPGTRTTATVNVNVTPATSTPIQYRLERAASVSQTAFMNSDFLETIRIRIYVNNQPAAGVPVLFTISGSTASGEFPNLAGGGPKFTNTITDADGYATALPIKANTVAGTFYVIASCQNQTVKFSLTNAQPNQ